MLFLIGFVAFLLLLIWLLPKLWRGIGRIFRKIGQWLGLADETRDAAGDPESPSQSLVEALQGLDVMHKSGALSDAEFEQAKASVIAEHQLA